MRISWWLAGVAVLPGCFLLPRDAPPAFVEGDVEILWQETGEAEGARFPGAFLVVEDEGRWGEVWAALHPGAAGPPPAARFDRERILAALVLTRVAGPYQVRIKAVRREKGGLRAVLDEGQFVYREPGDEAVTGIAYHLVKIRSPGSEEPVGFVYDNTLGN